MLLDPRRQIIPILLDPRRQIILILLSIDVSQGELPLGLCLSDFDLRVGVLFVIRRLVSSIRVITRMTTALEKSAIMVR